MRKFATGQPDAESKRGSGMSTGQKCVVSLAVIMVLAFVLRLVFSYGISAGDNYALSGGSNASSHLRIVLEILTGTYNPASQPQLNYPLGSASISGPLYDYLMAGIAGLVTLFGVSNVTAASGAMAWSAPIIGVLTAIPVYLIGKTLTDDETIGVVSALIFEFTALIISVTVFSYGAEYALLGFLGAFMVYFAALAYKAVDASDSTGFGVMKDKSVLIPTLASGVFFGLVALTWTDFRAIVIAIAVMLAIHTVVYRIKGKDIRASISVAVCILLVGTVIADVVYLVLGIWKPVAYGACVLAILTIAYALCFAALDKKPWVITIPVFLAVIIVVAVAIYYLVPDLNRAMLNGNGVYDSALVVALVDQFSRSSISSMGIWFGWVTVWMPLAVGAYMLYRYRRDSGKRIYDFTVLWLLAMFFMAWFDSSYAILAGAAMAVGAAILLVKVIRLVDVRGYLRSLKTLRGSGFKGAAKKVLNFFPFVTVLAVALLVIAPNTVYGFDASTPTNDEKLDYFGGVGYTIAKSDDSMISHVWNEYKNETKDGALLTWYGYSDSAAVYGGFDVVTNSSGNGSATMSAALLQNGSTGALSSMIVRILSADTSKVSAAVSSSGLGIDADTLKNLLTDVSAGKAALKGTSYESLDLADAVVPYYAVQYYLSNTLGLSDAQLCSLYDAACNITGSKIGYIEVDTGMLPLQYGDSSTLSTIAYLGGYSVGTYGDVSNFYSISTYNGYAYYTDAMYSTFIYQGLIGITPADVGETYSINLLSDLSLSDGKVKAVPGLGLTGFAVDKWYVMYNPSKDATGSSSGWVKMDGYEAIAKQNAEGGMINYLASTVVYKYVGVQHSLSGTVTCGAAAVPVPGVTVNVYKTVNYDSSGVTSSILFSSAVTGADGKYVVALPNAGAYTIRASTSASGHNDGNVFATDKYEDGVYLDTLNYGISYSNATGAIVTSNGSTYTIDGYMVLTPTSGNDVKVIVTGGMFSTGDILPGTYTAKIYAQNSDKGAATATATVTFVPGTYSDVFVTLTDYALTVTVTDTFTGVGVEGATVVVTDINSGIEFAKTIPAGEDGKVVFQVPNGTYSYYVSGFYTSAATTVTVSSAAKSASIDAYPAAGITISGAPAGSVTSVVSSGFQTVVDSTSTVATVPVTLGLNAKYFGYAIGSDGKLYAGVGYAGGTITLSEVASTTVTGTITKANGDKASTATVVFDSDLYYARTTTDDNGNYTIVLPRGTYSMYVSNASYENYYGTVELTADNLTKDAAMVAGNNYYMAVYYYTGMSSGSTKSVPYVDCFKGTVTISGTDYVFPHMMTSSVGRIAMAVPSGATFKATVGPVSSDYVYIGGKDNTSFDREISSSTSMYIQRTEPTTESTSYGWSYMKTVTAKTDSAYSGELKSYSDSSTTYTVVNGVINSGNAIVPGEYTFTMSGSKYFDGKVYVYPGLNDQTVTLSEEPFDDAAITFTNVGDKDTIVVTAYKNADGKTGKYVKDSDDSNKYHFQTGFEYLVTATDSDGKVVYSYIGTTGVASVTDLGTKAELVTVTGSLDAASSTGEIAFTFGTTVVRADITSGAYSVKLPVSTDVTVTVVSLKYEGSDNTYNYEADSKTFTTPANKDEKTVFNYGVRTSAVTPVANDYLSFVSGTIGVDGKVELKITLTYNGDYDGTTFLITGGDDLVLDETYAVTVARGSSESKVISGTWNTLAGAGTENVCIKVASLDGKISSSAIVPADYFPSVADKKVTLAISGAEKVSDAVNGYSYRYALNVTNDNNFAVKVFITGAMAATDGWSLFVSDSDNYNVYASPYMYLLNGKSSATYYIVAMSEKDLKIADTPAVTYTVSATAADTAADVTVDGAAATGTMNHGTVEIANDGGSVADGGSSMEAKKISMVFYVLIVLSIILLLLIFWAASKRGVFSRN